MARVAYIAEIDPREVAALGFLAGMLQGQGIQQGAVLGAILDRIQLVEVPDDFGGIEAEVDGDAEAETDAGNDPGVGGNVIPFPPGDNTNDDLNDEVLPENAYEPHGGELPAIDPANDPTAPENLGIELNKPNPYGPTVGGGFANPEDFGAGPPPRNS